MTTDELVRLIERDTARHWSCPDDFRAATCGTFGCTVTIGSLSSLAGCTRRSIEEAIQQARLEGTPIVTDGGIRVAQTAKDADALADWLDARMDTQRRTRDAVRAAAAEMATEEAEQAAAAALAAQPVQQSMELVAA